MWHQGPRTECQLLASLKSPVLNVLSKEHSGDICVRVPRALGSCENRLKPGLLQPPAEPVYQGLWRLTLTRFSPGLRLSAGKARVPWRLDSSPVPSLSCVCRTACWDTARWRTPGQPWSSTASPGEFESSEGCPPGGVQPLPEDKRPFVSSEQNLCRFCKIHF